MKVFDSVSAVERTAARGLWTGRPAYSGNQGLSENSVPAWRIFRTNFSGTDILDDDNTKAERKKRKKEIMDKKEQKWKRRRRMQGIQMSVT